MKLALLFCLVAGAVVQSVVCEGIHTLVGGSKLCPDLSLHSLPVKSPKYRRLLILNGRQRDTNNVFKDFRILSVNYVAVSDQKRSPIIRILKRWSILQTQPNNNFGLLQLKTHDFVPQNIQVIVKLNYNGKKCFLRSSVDSGEVYNSPIRHKRKLLEVKSESDDIQPSSHALYGWLTAATVLTMIIVLAMCTCGKKNAKDAISNEVGGVVVDDNVVSLSSTDKSEDVTERRETGNSKKSERLSIAENGSTRTASQSSQQKNLSVDGVPRLNSTSSHSSATKTITEAPPPCVVDVKVEDISVKTSNPGAVSDKERMRSQSTKEQSFHSNKPEDPKGFSQSDTFVYLGNEANIASSTQGKKQPVQPVMRKGSGKKENKEGEGKEKKKSWIRRKSSKHKENQPSKDDKKGAGRGTSRHSEVPLPPTPDGVQNIPPTFLEEENQYEAVETRPRKIQSEPLAAKSRPAAPQPARPSSELYASIDDENKRNSSGSHMYDMVETRKKEPVEKQENTSGLEYAYAVVAQKDKPIKPAETSSGSGLYEVVSDDMKRNVPTVVADDDYAVVQKDNSKKKAAARPLSDTDIAPAPPSVIHLPSQKQRAKSLGENLHELNSKANTLDANQPFDPDHTYAMVNKQTKTVNNDNNSDSFSSNLNKPSSSKGEHTYAKVNKQRKSIRSDTKEDQAQTSSSVIVVDDDSDEPPPIPPSLYAELPMQDGQTGSEGSSPSVVDNSQPTTTTTINTESVTMITQKVNEDSSHAVVHSQSSSHVVKTTTVVSSSNEQLSSKGIAGANAKNARGSQGDNTVVIPVNASPSHNPLYDEIHYV